MQWILFLLFVACAPDKEQGPFEQVEQQVWRIVNRSHTGRDGIFVQATMRTFAYEIASLYSKGEQEGLDQEQVLSRLRELIYQYVDGHYPFQDGTEINSLYYQYLVYVNRSFDPTNPIEKKVFDNWRAEYVRRLLGVIYDKKVPLAPAKIRRAMGADALQPIRLLHLSRQQRIRPVSPHRRYRKPRIPD